MNIAEYGVLPKDLFKLILLEVTCMKFEDALKSIDVALKLLGEKPTSVNISTVPKRYTIVRLNKIKDVLHAHLDTRATF